MKRKPEELDAKARKRCRDLLVAMANDAADHNVLEDFFTGLLTPSEQIMLGRRIWIARLLLGRKTYQEIGAELQVGPNTIHRTELWLQGLLPDYEAVLVQAETARLQSQKRRAAQYDPFSFAALKRKYPLHFLFFPEK